MLIKVLKLALNKWINKRNTQFLIAFFNTNERKSLIKIKSLELALIFLYRDIRFKHFSFVMTNEFSENIIS